MLAWLRELHREVYIGWSAIEIVPRQLKVRYFDLEIYRSIQGSSRFVRDKNEYLGERKAIVFRLFSGIFGCIARSSNAFGHFRPWSVTFGSRLESTRDNRGKPIIPRLWSKMDLHNSAKSTKRRIFRRKRRKCESRPAYQWETRKKNRVSVRKIEISNKKFVSSWNERLDAL